MRKILCIAPYQYLPYFSGGQKLIGQFYNYLSAEFELHVVSTGENDVTLAKEYKLYPWLASNKLKYADADLYFKIKKLADHVKPDYILIEHPYLAWLGWLLKKNCRLPLIYHTHNIEYQRFRSLKKIWWPLLKGYEAWALKNADYIFCISEADKKEMITQFNLDAARCLVVPFGTSIREIPAGKEEAKSEILTRHGLEAGTSLLFFNGLLNYQPNLDALEFIIHQLNPEIKKSISNYRIIIAGNKLPASYQSLKAYEKDRIIFTGFLKDIDTYTKGVDVLLNPVTSGGGVKTKVIDALAMSTSVVSTRSGAIGIDPETYGSKMQIVPDYNSHQFAAAVVTALQTKTNTPPSFYEFYYWGNIISNIKEFLDQHPA